MCLVTPLLSTKPLILYQGSNEIQLWSNSEPVFQWIYLRSENIYLMFKCHMRQYFNIKGIPHQLTQNPQLFSVSVKDLRSIHVEIINHQTLQNLTASLKIVFKLRMNLFS